MSKFTYASITRLNSVLIFIAPMILTKSTQTHPVQLTMSATASVSCQGERAKLFAAISKFGMAKVEKENPALLQKAKKERWVARAIFVQNCKGKWVPVSHKRKRTREQGVPKRKKAMTKQLKVLQAKVDKLKLAIELQEAAEQILQLKAKKVEAE